VPAPVGADKDVSLLERVANRPRRRHRDDRAV